jgi:hypothetical protein
MDSETNVLWRQIVAGVLFAFGLLWAIMAFVFFADVVTRGFNRFFPILFWGLGSLIWISWGLIVFHKLGRVRELAVWIFSAGFHGALTTVCVWHLWVGDSFAPAESHRLIVLPIWWTVALAGSVAGIVLALRQGGERRQPNSNQAAGPL